MVQINDDFHENLTIESLDRLITEIASKTDASDASGAGQIGSS
jgi:hypothetical protein